MKKWLCSLIVMTCLVIDAQDSVQADFLTDLNEFNIFYINGVMNDPTGAAKSGELTSLFLGKDKKKVMSLHNATAGLPKDLLETFLLSKIDKLGEDVTVEFWNYFIGLEEPTDEFLYQYATLLYQREGLVSAGGDYLKMYNKIVDRVEATGKKKTLLISHSEGNFFSNALVDRLNSQNPDLGSCTAIAAVGTPASRVANDGDWVTSNLDAVINGARILDPEVKPANLYPAGFRDFLGHNYISTYLAPPADTALKNRVIKNAVDTVNANCSDCGETLNQSGGQGLGQRFTYKLPNVAQSLSIVFEAYNIPDKLTVKANGRKIVDTKVAVSGYHEFSFNYNPNIHGTKLEVVVDAPKVNTKWKLCVNCEDVSSTCDWVQQRKDVSITVANGSAWRCSEGEILIDGQAVVVTPSFSYSWDSKFIIRKLSLGDHTFRWTAGCVCKQFNGCYNTSFNPGRQPSIRIDNFKDKFTGKTVDFIVR